MDIPSSGSFPVAAMDEALLMYLVTYVTGIQARRAILSDLYDLAESLERDCFIWPQLKTWIRDLRLTLDVTQRDSRNPFSHSYTFEHSVAVAQEVGHRINHF